VNFAKYRLFFSDLTIVHMAEGLLLAIWFLTYMTVIMQESLIPFFERFRQTIICTVYPSRCLDGVLRLIERGYGLHQSAICTHLCCIQIFYVAQKKLCTRTWRFRQTTIHKHREMQGRTVRVLKNRI
jgi:hypothetical protein